MKTTFLTSRLMFPTVVGAALFAIGCQESTTQEDVAEAEQDLREAQQEMTEAARKGQQDVAEARREAQPYSVTQARDAFVNDAEQKLADAEARIEQLEQSASSAEGADKEALDRQIETLRSQHDRAEEALDELKSAEPANWQTHQQGVRTAMQDLNTGLSRIR